jgi:hypothetical protein
MALFEGNAPDFDADTIKVGLFTDSYTPDFHGTAGDIFYSDISGVELANGNGYTTGGVTLASKTITWDDTNSRALFDCADPSWTFTASKAFRYAAVYKSTGTPSTSRLVSCIDFGATRTETGTFSIRVNSAGLLRVN